MKRRSKGDAGADGGFDGSGIAVHRWSALIREAPDARAGAEAESWHARGGVGPHPKSNCKERGRAAPSLCLLVHGDSRSASRPPWTRGVLS